MYKVTFCKAQECLDCTIKIVFIFQSTKLLTIDRIFTYFCYKINILDILIRKLYLLSLTTHLIIVLYSNHLNDVYHDIFLQGL